MHPSSPSPKMSNGQAQGTQCFHKLGPLIWIQHTKAQTHSHSLFGPFSQAHIHHLGQAQTLIPSQPIYLRKHATLHQQTWIGLQPKPKPVTHASSITARGISLHLGSSLRRDLHQQRRRGEGRGGGFEGGAETVKIHGFRGHDTRRWVSSPTAPSTTPRKQSKRTARGPPSPA